MRKLLAILLLLTVMPSQAHALPILRLGFEWQTVTDGQETGTNYGLTSSTVVVHGGSRSLLASGSMAADSSLGMDHPFAASATVYARWYVYLDSLPSAGLTSTFLDLYSTATNVIALDIVNSGGTYTVTPFYNNFGGNLTAFDITPDTWHRVEVLYDTSPANGSEVFRVYVDGVEEAASTALTFTTKTVNLLSQGVYNGAGAGTVSTEVVYFDDFGVNDNTGASANSYPGDGKIVILSPTSNGDTENCSNASEDYADVSEVPPSTTATAGSTMCQLDSNGDMIEVNLTNSSSAGIDSYDTITLVYMNSFQREEAAGTSAYTLRMKSASGATATTSPSADAGNATPRTNPVSTTAFSRFFATTTDPTTNVAWTPTGTNSIDNMQIGVSNADGDSTPDLWVLTLAAFVEYVDGTAPSTGTTVDPIIWFE